MFEVRILSAGENVALNKAATQSSTLRSFAAGNAVDGATGSTSFSHTNPVKKFAWWEVDMQGTYAVDEVSIVNRYCRDVSDANGCLCRLSHSAVLLLDGNDNWVASEFIGDTCGQLEVTITFQCDE
jgi:hypothetical protein